MSILFIEGFDHFVFDGAGGRKWDQGANGSVTSGRWGGQCLLPGSSGSIFVGQWDGTHRRIPPTTELIIGCAMRFDSFVQEHPFLMLLDNREVQCSFHIDPISKNIVLRTGRGLALTDFQLLDTGVNPPLLLWFYLEIKIKIGGTTGSCEVRLNGITIATVGGIQTQQSGNNYANRIAFCGLTRFGSNYQIDDLYLINTQDGIGEIDFLGELRVQTKYPDAQGFATDFAPSVGYDNFDNVDVPVTNWVDTGRRNTSSAVAATDLYSIENYAITGPIYAVQGNLVTRKEDVGNRTSVPIIRTNSSNFEGTPTAPYSEYTYSGKLWEKNPSTGVNWTISEMNLVQFGIKIKT